MTGTIPAYIDDSNFFVYRNGWMDMEMINMGSWLIFSKYTNNKILLETQSLLYAYWKKYNYIKNYFLMHIFFRMVTDANPELWEQVPAMNHIDSHLLMQELPKHYDENRCQQIMRLTPIHKLTYKVETSSGAMAVLISLPLSSSYVYEGETRGFVSFAGTTFLLCPIAIFVFALLAVQYNLWHRKRYVIAMFVPSLCIMLGTTRTYLGVLACAWMLFLYTQIKNKKMYFAVIAIAAVVLVGIVLLSPIKEKFISASSRTEIGIDPLAAFTSGRSTFWTYDILTMIKNNPIRILFGNGVNYLFKINYAHFGNPLWAHNDFIQIFSDYGLFGLLVYLGMFITLFKKTFDGIRISKMAMMMLVAIWAFNALENTVWTNGLIRNLF